MYRILAALLLLGVSHGFAASQCEVVESDAHVTSSRTIEEHSPVSIGLFRVEPSIEGDAYSTVEAASRKLEAEFRTLGRDVSVTPYTLESDCGTGLYGDCFNEIEQIGDHTHYHLWAGYSSSLCGQAYLNGDRAWTAISCGVNTVIHEQGHNFGLHHSSQGDREYGWSTWMGTGSRSEFAAQHIALQDVDLETGSGNGTYFLTSAYAPAEAGLVQLVSVEDYFVSLWEGRVVVSSGGGSRINLLATLRADETISVGGVHFTLSGEPANGIAKVTVDHNVHAQPAAGDPPPPSLDYPYEDGLYVDPDAKHQGVMVMGRTVYWMTWDRNLRPLWYWGQDGTLYRAERLYGETTAVTAGTYELTDRGLSFYTETLGRGEFPMSRITAPEGDPLTGHWGFGDGRGLVLQTQNGWVYGYLLGYSEKSYLHNPKPLQWHLVTGPAGGDLQIHEPRLAYPGLGLDPLIDLIDTTRIENGIWMRDGSRLRRIQ